MKLLDSLLDAIVRLEGDALVMHVGEKPYVVTASSSMNAYRGPLAWGQVELSSRVLTFDAVSSMLGQILPADQQQALTEFGAIEHEIPSPVGVADRFTVVAARGGADVWVELRRRPTEAVPEAAAVEQATAVEQARAIETVQEAEVQPLVQADATASAAMAPAATAKADTPTAAPPVVDAAPPADVTSPVDAAPVAEAPAVSAAADTSVTAEPAQQASTSAVPVIETHEPAAETHIQEVAGIHNQKIEVVPESPEQPAADIGLETNRSIVVSIPGHDAQEIALDAVPDNAIQIVDDEAQGVPTEEEVDAMLAATAGAILTSGIGEVFDDGTAAVDDETVAEGEPDDSVEGELEIDLDGEMVRSALTLPLTVSAVAPVESAPEEPTQEESVPEVAALAEPAFELSPPPLEMEVEPSEPEVAPESPVGTPLFSEEAILAAAAIAADNGQPPAGVGFAKDTDAAAEAVTPPSEVPPHSELPPPIAPEFAAQSEPPAWDPPILWVPQPSVQFEALASAAPAVDEPPTQEQVVDQPVALAEPLTPVDSAPELATPARFEALSSEAPLGSVLATEPVETEPVATLDQPSASDATGSADMIPVGQPEPALETVAPPTDLPTASEPEPPITAAEEPVVAQETVLLPEEPVAAPVEPVAEPVEPAPAAATSEAAEPIVEQASVVTTEVYVAPQADLVTTPEPVTTPEFVTTGEPVAAPVMTSEPLTAPVTTSEPLAAPVMNSEPLAEVTATEEPAAAPAMEAVQPFVEEPSVDASPTVIAAPTDVDANTLSQSAEPEASELLPPIEAPSVSEMTMEVTPDLRQQEAPMADTTGQAAEVSTHKTPEPVHAEASDESRHAVVVPLGRTPVKPEVVTAPFTPSEDAALMHTLRAAAARGASTVYVVAQSKPMIRIDGEIGPLENEPILTAADVERLVIELAPPRRREALQNGPVEWLCDVPEIGRVRCLTFRDHRGPGVLFRMIPPRAISADQLGLTPEVQALCQQSDGLVLVTGGRASGKSTLLNSFVDLINRTRSDYLITIESQIGFVHESRRSFVSQRETRGDGELAATYARAALREDPDVMVIDDLKSPELVLAALEAAESGRLVLASVAAASTIAAIERVIEVLPADRRTKARSTLAAALRGVIAQVLLRRVSGGRAVAREILLNTPAVSQIVLEGKMFQLPVALDSGRRHGMIPLTDSLAAHVRGGTVDVAEAYRKALDRAALVALLKREGFDTSFAERLA